MVVLTHHGIEFNLNEASDIVMNKIQKCYGDTGLEFNESKTDQAHCIVKPTIDKNSKKK